MHNGNDPTGERESESTSSGPRSRRNPWVELLLARLRELDDQADAPGEGANITIPEWVALTGVSSRAVALYAFLAAHLDHLAGHRYVWPLKADLAAMMGVAKDTAIDPPLKELVGVGAVTVFRVQNPSGPGVRLAYKLPALPPDETTTLGHLEDWYGARGRLHPNLHGVVRAERLPRPRRPVGRNLRWEVFVRDDFRCQACGTRYNLTVDHIDHRSKGGPDTLENLRTLCRSCNSRRGDRLLPEVDG